MKAAQNTRKGLQRHKKTTRGTLPTLEYLERVRLIREMISGDDTRGFAKAIGVPPKRWLAYERGTPIPREIALRLWNIFEISIDWLWCGQMHTMEKYQQKIEAVMTVQREQREARKELRRVQARVRSADDKRRKILQVGEPITSE